MSLPRALPDALYEDPDGDQPGALLLRCTACGGRLVHFPEDRLLLCPSSRLLYSITEEDIPIMLVEEAEEVDAAEVERLLARARELGLPVPE